MTSWLLPLIGFSLAAVSFYKSGSFPKVKEEVCDTPACNHVSTIIRNFMNTSIDPCDDFYEFTCGNRKFVRSSQSIYRRNGPTGPQFSSLADYLIKDALESEPSDDDIPPIKQMKKLHKSCMNLEARKLEGIQRILSEFKKMGGWRSNVTWQEIDRYYDELLGLNTFYTIGADGEALVIREPPNLGVVGSWFYILRKFLKPAMKNMTLLMNANLSNSEIDMLMKLRWVLLMEWRTNRREDKRFEEIPEFLKMLEPIQSSYLSTIIDWMEIFERLSEKTNRTLLKDTPIILQKWNEDSYVTDQDFPSVNELSGAIGNQVQWNFLLEMMPYASLEAIENIIPLLAKAKILQKSWLSDCLLKDEPASIYLYGKKYDCPNEKVQSMHINTQRSLVARIDRFSGVEFKEACSKLNDYDAELIDYYKDLTMGESYIENIFNLKKTKKIGTVRRLGKPVPWINFTAARVLDSPLYSYHSSLPDYYGYGYLMTKIMSSQIHHEEHRRGFGSNDYILDSEYGCHFPLDYSRIGYAEKGLPRIFHIWALEAAWKAYEKVKKEKFPKGEMKLPELTGFTDDQMFFISYAQGECFGPGGVNDVLSTTFIFSEAFKCKNNSRMNPEKRCNPYPH